MNDIRFLKRSDIRRLMNYLVNKKYNIHVIDEYNNSVGEHKIREYKGIVKSFELSKMNLEICEYCLTIKFESGYKFKVWLNADYEIFSEFGSNIFRAGYCNSGPMCYFEIIK